MTFMKKISLLIGDPARAGDSFGALGGDATWPDKKIYFRYAKEFKRKSYNFVASHFSKLYKVVKPHFILLEDNFEKPQVSQAFRKYNVPVKWVHTSANLNENTRRKYTSLDKPFAVEWLAAQKKDKRIFYGEGSDMQILIDQTVQIVPFMTQNGGTTYRAQRGRHDDLFSCSLIFANFVRLWWEELDNS